MTHTSPISISASNSTVTVIDFFFRGARFGARFDVRPELPALVRVGSFCVFGIGLLLDHPAACIERIMRSTLAVARIRSSTIRPQELYHTNLNSARSRNFKLNPLESSRVDASLLASEVTVNTEDEIPWLTFSTCCLILILHPCRIIQSSSGSLKFVRKAEPPRKTIKKTAFMALFVPTVGVAEELYSQTSHCS